MSSSIHNSDSSPKALTVTTPGGALRRGTPPPSEAQPIVAHILLDGDDAGSFLDLRARTQHLSGQSPDFAGFLSDVLTAQSWEFCRAETMRSCAMALQMKDDRDEIDASFKEIDDPTRQLLAWNKLAAKASFRELGRESDRYFRRLRHGQDAIHKAVLRRPR